MRLLVAALVLLAGALAAIPPANADTCVEKVVCTDFDPWTGCTSYWAQDPNGGVRAGATECEYTNPSEVCLDPWVQSGVISEHLPKPVCVGYQPELSP